MVSVILRSSDGADHEVSELVASASKTIRSLLEDLEVKEDLKEALIVPLPNVCDRTLRKVLVYCTHHTNCGEAETPDIDKEIQSWDVKYMSISTDELFHLVMAAHYLNIPGLLDLCCDAVADHIRDKSPQQLRECFGLKSNFLPEEEREIRRVNAWALACEK